MRLQPARVRPLVAATASGRLERNTAASMAALTTPPWRIVRPSTIDSGIPSSTVPRTIASGEPDACSPDELFRLSPP